MIANDRELEVTCADRTLQAQVMHLAGLSQPGQLPCGGRGFPCEIDRMQPCGAGIPGLPPRGTRG
jgi:hypothetical protein